MSDGGLVRTFLPERLRKAVDGWEALQQAKAKRWWEAFCSLEHVDPLDVESDIMARVADGDEKTIQAIKEGAAAALDAAESAVLPSMALVARSYMRGDVPPWFLRGLLGLLRSLSAAEYGRLRDLVHLTAATLRTNAHEYVRVFVRADRTSVDLPSGTSGSTEGPRIEGAMHLFSELKRHGLAHDYAKAGLAALQFDPRVVFWLQDALPPNRTPQ